MSFARQGIKALVIDEHDRTLMGIYAIIVL